MKIHEYQGKEILRNFGVPVPRGIPAFTVQEAVEAAQKLGGPVWVVKAQIHAGGRGKGGGVKLAKSPEEAEQIATQMLGMTLVTHQTGPEGRLVQRLLVEETLPIEKELYLGIVLDREVDVSRGDWLLASDALPHSREVLATVAWMDDVPLSAGRVYWALHGRRWVKAKVSAIVHKVDIQTLQTASTETAAGKRGADETSAAWF